MLTVHQLAAKIHECCTMRLSIYSFERWFLNFAAHAHEFNCANLNETVFKVHSVFARYRAFSEVDESVFRRALLECVPEEYSHKTKATTNAGH